MKRIIWLIALTPAIAFANKTFNEGSGGTVDCSKDPDATINLNNGKFAFKGACKSITINGNSNTLAIDSVASLSVNGNDNKVSYGGKPKVSNLGNNNTLVGGKAAPADKQAPPPAEDEDDAAERTAIDCKKKPTYAVSGNGNQALKFTGTCDKISVETGENRLSIENVKTIVLNGGLNQVSIGGVDAIVTNGGKNNVTYKKGLSGAKPKVSGGGAGNTVVQAK